MTIPIKSFSLPWEFGALAIAWGVSKLRSSTTSTSRLATRTLQEGSSTPSPTPRRIQVRPVDLPIDSSTTVEPINHPLPPRIIPRPPDISQRPPVISEPPPVISEPAPFINVQTPIKPLPPMPPDKPLPVIEKVTSQTVSSSPKVLTPFTLSGLPFWLPALPPVIYRRYFSKENHLYNVEVKIDAPSLPTAYKLEIRKANRAFTFTFELAMGRPLRILPQSKVHFVSSGMAKSLFNKEEGIFLRATRFLISSLSPKNAVSAIQGVFSKSISSTTEQAQMPQRPFLRHTEYIVYIEDALYEELDPKLHPKKYLIPFSTHEVLRIIHGKKLANSPETSQEPPQRVEWDLLSKCTLKVANLSLPFEKRKAQSFELSIKKEDDEHVSVSQEVL